MKIMITGARGRLGSVITGLAASQGHRVLAADRSIGPPRSDLPTDSVEEVGLDVGDYDAVLAATEGVDAVIHCAALTQPIDHRWDQVHNQNVTGSYNVLLAAATSGVPRVCAMSSVNALGGVFSRLPRFDYFPLDTAHPSYAEDPYSLSKHVLEGQARSIVRRFPDTAVMCLRLHALQDREDRVARCRQDPGPPPADLWGYSPLSDSARLCLSVISSEITGAETLYAVASRTASDLPTEELRRRYFPSVPARRPLPGHDAFYDSSPARERFGWDA